MLNAPDNLCMSSIISTFALSNKKDMIMDKDTNVFVVLVAYKAYETYQPIISGIYSNYDDAYDEILEQVKWFQKEDDFKGQELKERKHGFMWERHFYLNNNINKDEPLTWCITEKPLNKLFVK